MVRPNPIEHRAPTGRLHCLLRPYRRGHWYSVTHMVSCFAAKHICQSFTPVVAAIFKLCIPHWGQTDWGISSVSLSDCVTALIWFWFDLIWVFEYLSILTWLKDAFLTPVRHLSYVNHWICARKNISFFSFLTSNLKMKLLSNIFCSLFKQCNFVDLGYSNVLFWPGLMIFW